jgi:hypothetical protein
MTDSPVSSPNRPLDIDRKVLVEISHQAIEEYLQNHPNGRGAKFHKASEPKKGPKVGTGFSEGDVIFL